MKNPLCREAAEDAIIKHRRIIENLKQIVVLNYGDFRVVDNQTEEVLEDLNTLNMIVENVKIKARSIVADKKDLETCYEQMGVFKDVNN